jgi:glycine/D-amino acid oxidase-like deaminating enzyme
MPIHLTDCARMLAHDGVRHHVDMTEGVIRTVFVTRHYRNPRGERLAIVRLDTPDDGHRCRASLPRAFSPGVDPARTCLALCRMAAETPAVGVEFDAEAEGLRLVVETIVEDGRLTPLQLVSMIDRVVAAAEAWSASLESTAPAPRVRPRGRSSPRRPAA